VSSGAAFTVFRELRLGLRSCVYAYRSCVCGTVAAQQRKSFRKRSIICKDVYCM